MKRTSSEEHTPTESRRLVRGAGRAFHEYISKLRTEIFNFTDWQSYFYRSQSEP